MYGMKHYRTEWPDDPTVRGSRKEIIPPQCCIRKEDEIIAAHAYVYHTHPVAALAASAVFSKLFYFLT